MNKYSVLFFRLGMEMLDDFMYKGMTNFIKFGINTNHKWTDSN